jgi:hypothetical protein
VARILEKQSEADKFWINFSTDKYNFFYLTKIAYKSN